MSKRWSEEIEQEIERQSGEIGVRNQREKIDKNHIKQRETMS